MSNWKEAIKVRGAMLNAKGGITVNGVYIPPIMGKGFIHDRFSCSCGWTDRSNIQTLLHKFRNLPHKMRQNW